MMMMSRNIYIANIILLKFKIMYEVLEFFIELQLVMKYK